MDCCVKPRYMVLFLLLAVAGGGWCQTQLLDPEPRTCRTQDNAAYASAFSQERRNEYPAGGVLMVLAKVPAGLFGFLQVYLCPEGDAQVECLDRVPLQLADGSGTSFNLLKVPRTDKYEIPVILPDDIICPTCTLQLRVLTRDCADQDACPLTEDTFCSDITVRELTDEKEDALAETQDEADNDLINDYGNERVARDKKDTEEENNWKAKRDEMIKKLDSIEKKMKNIISQAGNKFLNKTSKYKEKAAKQALKYVDTAKLVLTKLKGPMKCIGVIIQILGTLVSLCEILSSI